MERVADLFGGEVEQVILAVIVAECEDRSNLPEAFLIKPYLKGAEELADGKASLSLL